LPTGRYDHDVALRIRRTHGEEGLREYERTFLLDEDEGFLPKLQIFDTCKELINCLPLCIYDKNKVEDVEEFDGDDPYDNLRYNLKACQNLLVTGTSSALQEEQRVQVLNALAKTQNMTAFYMNMNNLESKERRSNQPISRRRYGSRRRVA